MITIQSIHKAIKMMFSFYDKPLWLLVICMLAAASSTTMAQPVTSGLVAYYPFNNSPNEESGNGNNGTENGGVAYAADRFGNALSAATFDGDDDYIQSTQALNLGTNNRSVSVWVQVPEVGNGGLEEGERGGIIIGNYDQSPHLNLEIHTNGRLRFFYQFNSVDLYGTTDLRDGKWHHVVFSAHPNGDVEIHLDGQLEASGNFATTINNTTSAVRIGGDFRNGGGPKFHGQMDDLSVFNRVLTYEEILTIYSENDWLQTGTSSFITTWQVSDNEEITIPTAVGETYNYTVDWGDGTIASGLTGDASHTYTVGGNRTIAIAGTFPRILFRDSGMEEKILSVDQWGAIQWSGMSDAFFGCLNLTVPAPDAPDLSNVNSISQMFFGCSSFDQSIDHWDVSNVQYISNVFAATPYNQPLNSWDVSGATSLNYLFQNNAAFNQPLDNWDVSNVDDMYGMFSGAGSFNQDISNWNVSNVTITSNMFFGATSFNQDLGTWDVSSVTNMTNMFNGASSFNQDLSNWTVGQVTSMAGMFSGTAFNQDISGWDVSAVRDMSLMFQSAPAFDQNLGLWDISGIIVDGGATSFSMSQMFENCGMSILNYEQTLAGWATQETGEGPVPTDVTLGASGLQYCNDTGRSALVSLGWTITGDTQNCPDELVNIPFNGDISDQSPYGNVINGVGVELSANRFGINESAAKFDGVDDELTMTGFTSSLDGLTIASWINILDGSGTSTLIDISGVAGIVVEESELIAVLRVNGDYLTRFLGPISINEWHHVAMNYDQTNFKVYLDGESIFEEEVIGTITPETSTYDITLGRVTYDFINYYNGLLDEVQILARSSTATEIADMYSQGGYIPARESLMALYNSTDGPNWANNTNWGTDADLSTWYGVTVENGNVVGVDLRSNGLNGIIPPEIGNLITLKTLFFFNNPALGGNIPTEIGNLTNLESLNISLCDMEGIIPESIGNLVNLNSNLSFSRNRLSGPVPTSLTNLSNVPGIFLYQNELTSLPDFSGFSSLSNLWVYDNKIGFSDLITNLPVEGFGTVYRYDPQTIEEEVLIVAGEGETLELNTSELTSGTQYQWYFNDQPIDGANAATYSFDFTSADEGTYHVSMTNDNIVNLTITTAPYRISDGQNNLPTGISLSSDIVREGVDVGTFIATLSTEDVDVDDTYTYELVSGEGDTDNGLFAINGDALITNAAITNEKSQLSIRLRTTDGGGETFEASLLLRLWPIQICNNEVLTDASGTISDGSGEFDYDNNFECSWQIEIPTGQVKLEFTEFDTEFNWDFVRVYDGVDESGNLLGEFSGSDIPQTLIASSSQMHITFKSDQINVGSGWVANYSTLSPVANYPFDGSTVDVSVNGNDANNFGAVLTSDRFGNGDAAFSFDGVDDYMQAPSPIFTNINDPFSINLWVRWDGNTSNFTEILSWLDDSSTDGGLAYIGTITGSSEMRFGDAWINTGVNLPADEWVNLGATYDGSVASIYINGNLMATSGPNLQYDLTKTGVYIGRQGTINGEYFGGLIDDILIFDFALSADEMESLFSFNKSDLFAYYQFNESLVDVTNNGFDVIESGPGNGFGAERLGEPLGAYEFNSANAAVLQVPNTANYDFGTEITLEAWIKPTSFNGSSIQIIGNETDGNGFKLSLVPGDLSAADLTTKRRLHTEIYNGSWGSLGEVILNQWTHVAFTYTTNVGISAYINGQKVGGHGYVPNAPISVSTSPIEMGASYDGLIDEVKVYNKALSDNELYASYDELRWPFHTLAFRGPEGQGINTFDRLMNIDPTNGQKYMQALLLDLSGDYQFRATADEFEAFMGDNELDNIAEPGGTQINLTNGFYAVTFDQNTLGYLVEPITSVGILGSALTGDDTGWNEDIDLTDLGNGIYQIQNLELFDGEFKLRPNDSWAIIDWGDFGNDGVLDYRGANIPIAAGTYTMTFDLVNNLYTTIESGSTPVAFLEFDEDLLDDSGFGNNGLSTSSTYTNGRLGETNTAIQLTSTDEISLGNDPSLQLSNGFTMNIWVNPTVNDNAAVLFQSENSFHNHLFAAEMSWRYFQGEQEYQIDNIPITTPNGSWNMITWTYDGGVMKFYDDGVLVHSETVFGDLDITENNYVIGAGFEGAVDGFQWIDGVLSDQEIQYLYTEGVIFDFPFDGNLTDITGNGFDGSFTNGGSYVSDRFGLTNAALSLDGTQNVVLNTGDAVLLSGNEATFEGWFRVLDVSNSPILAFTPGLLVYLDDEGFPIFAPEDSQISYSTQSSTSVTLNEWFHLAGTYDGVTSKIYFNGVETNSIDWNMTMLRNNIPTAIGGEFGRFFNGDIDDVTLYNYALSPQEIHEIAAEGEFFGSSANDLLSFGVKTSLDNPEFEYLGSFNGSDYYLTSTTALWNDQKVAAEEVGGQMAVINSQEENDFIAGLIGESVFIGLSDQNSEGNYVWVDGSSLTYENWAELEPNGGAVENYAEFLTDGFWNDINDVQLKALIENPSRQATIDQDNGTVSVTVPFETDLAQIAPVFAVSDFASAFVLNEQQVNGETIVDFTSPVTYSIVAEDGFSTQDYLVTIAKDSIEGDSLALIALYNSTDGANWNNTWNLDMPMNTWHGISVNNEGRVTGIDMPDNNLTGTIPSEVGRLSKLTFLDLSANNLSGGLPAEIWQLTSLTELYINNNQLSGTIPVEVGNLTNLTGFGLSFNDITGEIPAEIGSLDQLQFLFLENNRLNGSIPPELGNLSKLIRLQLSDNELSGTIPDELSGLISLEFLLLLNNQLSGSIPSGLASISALRDAYFGNNELSGAVPVEFGQNANLATLQIQDNQFTSLPDLTGASFGVGLFVENNKIGFADIITNLPIEIFGYNPQVIEDTVRVTLSTGEALTLSTIEETTGTNYQWQKDGETIDGATERTYDLEATVGSEGEYTVVMTNNQVADLTITRAPYVIDRLPNTETFIESVTIDEVAGTVSGTTFSVILPFGSDLTNLIPEFVIAPGATISPDISVARDFTTPQVYTVTAEDGVTTEDWTIEVDDQLNTATEVISLSINGVQGVITNTLIEVELPFGDDLTSLKPEFEVSFGATIAPDTAVARDFTNDQVYTVTAEDGVNSQDWTVRVTNAEGTDAEIITASINGVQGEIANDQVNIVLPFGSDRTSLTMEVQISAGASIAPDPTVARDYTDPVTYTVTAADGVTEKVWTINVTNEPNNEAEITSLTINGVEGQINVSSVDIVLPFGTDLTSLTPEISISEGATISPDPAVARDYTEAQVFTVTAENGTVSKNWTINVTDEPNTAADIVSFSILGVEGQISGNVIEVELGVDQDLTSLTATYELSFGATINPDPSQAIDYTNERSFTVTAEDGINSQDWKVRVSNEPRTEAEITSFSINGVSGVFDGADIDVVLPAGVSLTSLTPVIEISPGATISPNADQARDFTEPQDYVVTAEDGVTEKTWTVTVTNELSSAAEIISLSVNGVEGVITDGRVEVVLGVADPLTDLKPDFVISAGATIAPDTTFSRDFTEDKKYTIVAEDGVTSKEWTVSVTNAINDEADIKSVTINGVAGIINNQTVVVTLPFGTPITNLFPEIEISLRATINLDTTVGQNFNDQQVYRVTAEAGNFKDWTVAVEVEEEQNVPPEGLFISNSVITAGATGKIVGKIGIDDEDNEITDYELTITDGADNFEISSSNQVQTLQALTAGNYNLVIEASGPHTISETFTINVIDASAIQSAFINVVSALGRDIDNYSIVGVPTASVRVSDFFSNAADIGKSFRILSYNTGTGTSSDLSGSSTISAGKGYWFIAAEEATVQLPDNATPAVLNSRNEYELGLVEGWNLVGNPFNAGINWSTVIQYNIDQNYILDGDIADEFMRWINGGYTNRPSVASFGGGFVKSNSAITLHIPSPDGVSSSGGRVQSIYPDDAHEPTLGYFNSQDDWKVNIRLSGDRFYSEVSGVSFDPKSTSGLDHFDVFSPPMVTDEIKLDFRDIATGASVNKVPYQSQMTWEMMVDATISSPKLDWDTELVNQLAQPLYLILPKSRRIVDMRHVSSIDIGDSQQPVKIHYGTEPPIPGMVSLSQIYPNPAQDQLNVRFMVQKDLLRQSGQLIITDLSGKMVANRNLTEINSLSKQINVDIAELGSGVYLVHLELDQHKSQTIKLIKQ